MLLKSVDVTIILLFANYKSNIMKTDGDKKVGIKIDEVISKSGKGGEGSKKKFYFIAGLPRSGSTLLANILAQNPKFHTTSTSGVMDVMFGVRNNWDNLIEFKGII